MSIITSCEHCPWKVICMDRTEAEQRKEQHERANPTHYVVFQGL